MLAGGFEVVRSERASLRLCLASLALLLSTLFVASPASAAAVDLSFTLKVGEDTSCRQWEPDQQVSWNFTLAMNGTDSSLITTPTYVWVNDSAAPAMQDDGWVAVLAASGDFFANPPSFDAANSNDLATSPAVYSPSNQGVDIALFSGGRGAPVTNLTLIVAGSSSSQNKDHYLTVSARTHRQGTTDITRTVSLCVHIPPQPRFEMGARDSLIQTVPDATVSVYFWLNNTGNTPDYYFCNATVPTNNWTWQFGAGMNQAAGQNFSNFLNLSENLTIRVDVTVPANARPRANSTVSLNCTSYKGMQQGMILFLYPPQTLVEVIQVFQVSGQTSSGNESTMAGLPGETVGFDFSVQNRGNGRDQGRARLVSGNFAGWASWATNLMPSDFDLEAAGDPGFEATAQFLVTIPAGAPIGTYEFTLNISSVVNGTPVTTLRFRVQVLQEYIPLISPVPAQVLAPGDEVLFNFTITNAGNGLDSLVIEIANLSGWRVFLAPPVGKKLLQANEPFPFQATVIAPRPVQTGRYDQRVRITSEYAQLDLGLTIFAETNLTVIVPAEHACEWHPPDGTLEANPRAFPGLVVDAQASLSLFNLGRGADTFTLSAAAPAALAATLAPAHPSLGFQSNTSIVLSLRTGASPLAGPYLVRLSAHSDANSSVACAATFELRIVYPPGPPLPSSLNLTINGVRTGQVEADTPALFEVDLANLSGYWLTWWADGAAAGAATSPTFSLPEGAHNITVRISNGSASRDFSFAVVAVASPAAAPTPPPPPPPVPPSPPLPPAVNLTVNGSTNPRPVAAGAPVSLSLDLANASEYNVSWFVDLTPAGMGPEVSLTLSAGSHNVTAVVSNATDSESYSFDVVAREVPTVAPESGSFLPIALLLAVAGGAAALVLVRHRAR